MHTDFWEFVARKSNICLTFYTFVLIKNKNLYTF